MTTELLFLVLILGVWFRYRLAWREWGGSLAAAGGLATFLVLADPGGGNVVPTRHTWIVVFVVIGAASAGCAALGFTGPRWFRAAMFGSAGAVIFALSAALTKQFTTLVSEGWGHVFTDWVPYAMVATGVIGLFLIQSAFHAGPITASQAAITIVDPIVSVVIGIYLFHDRLDTAGWRLPVEVVAIVVVVGRDAWCCVRHRWWPGPRTTPGKGDKLVRQPRGADRRNRFLTGTAQEPVSTERNASSRSGWRKPKPDRCQLLGPDALAGQHHVRGHLRAEGELEGGCRYGHEGRAVEGVARGPWPARRRWPGRGAMALTGPDRVAVVQAVQDHGHLVVQRDPAPVLASGADPAAHAQPEQRQLLGQCAARRAQYDAGAQQHGPDARLGRRRCGRLPVRRTPRPGIPNRPATASVSTSSPRSP